jgi:hypothetical protein
MTVHRSIPSGITARRSRIKQFRALARPAERTHIRKRWRAAVGMSRLARIGYNYFF